MEYEREDDDRDSYCQGRQYYTDKTIDVPTNGSYDSDMFWQGYAWEKKLDEQGGY